MAEETKALKVFLSVPMQFKSDDQIKAELKMLQAYYEATFTNSESIDIEFVDNFKPQIDGWWQMSDEERNRIRMYHLGEAIQKMSGCHKVLFYPGWEHHRGCFVEHVVAERYGLRWFDV